MASAPAREAVHALQMQTMNGTIKALTKRVQAFESSAPPAKRPNVTGKGHLSDHDVQLANLHKVLSKAVRIYMNMDAETVGDVPPSDRILTFFDATTGMRRYTAAINFIVRCRH